MFSISSLSSSVHSLSSKFFYSISFFFSFIVFIVLYSLALSPFHCLQFLSNLVQYSLSYLLSDHPNNFLTINLPGNSPLLNVSSFLSCLWTFSMSCQYSFLNSSTASFVFSRFSTPSQVSDSTINPFHYTKYLSFPLICCLFSIFSTSHSFSFSITTGASYFFLCSSTCPTYFCTLLTLTTGCIFTVLDSLL